MVFSTALLLSLDRVGSGQEESEDQEGQKNELVVEDEHDVGAMIGLLMLWRVVGLMKLMLQ